MTCCCLQPPAMKGTLIMQISVLKIATVTCYFIWKHYQGPNIADKGEKGNVQSRDWSSVSASQGGTDFLVELLKLCWWSCTNKSNRPPCNVQVQSCQTRVVYADYGCWSHALHKTLCMKAMWLVSISKHKQQYHTMNLKVVLVTTSNQLQE